jgi:hypothetical protein
LDDESQPQIRPRGAPEQDQPCCNVDDSQLLTFKKQVSFYAFFAFFFDKKLARDLLLLASLGV